jgi:hypothetical protein
MVIFHSYVKLPEATLLETTIACCTSVLHTRLASQQIIKFEHVNTDSLLWVSPMGLSQYIQWFVNDKLLIYAYFIYPNMDIQAMYSIYPMGYPYNPMPKKPIDIPLISQLPYNPVVC